MTVPAIVSTIPGATSAIQYLASKVREFEQTGPQLLQLQHQAAVLAGVARNQGNLTAETKARRQVARFGELYREHGATMDRLGPVFSWFREQGFGIPVPAIVAVAAVAAVASVTFILAETANERQKLQLLASGILTPAQLAELERQTGNKSLLNIDLGAVVPWVVGGVALYWFITSRPRGGGGGLSW